MDEMICLIKQGYDRLFFLTCQKTKYLQLERKKTQHIYYLIYEIDINILYFNEIKKKCLGINT